MFRFRRVDGNAKSITKDILSLMRSILADITLVHYNAAPKERLTVVYKNVIEAEVLIRALSDMGDISAHDYNILTRYTSQMNKNIHNWNAHYNNKMVEVENTANDNNKQQ